MASRRHKSAGAGGSLVLVLVVGTLGHTYVPAFAGAVDAVSGWFRTAQPLNLPDSGAAGTKLASDLLNSLHNGGAPADSGRTGTTTPSTPAGGTAVTPVGPGIVSTATSDAVLQGGLDTAPETAEATAVQEPAALSALAALAEPPVKGWAPVTGYSRDRFGPAWTDDHDEALGRNGCDTRNDILARDLQQVSIKAGSCQVAAGTLHDPYTGADIAFTRGQDTSAAVQIDHVVSLGNAWATGAQHLAAQTRIDLANDPLNLLAVSGPVNEQKSDRDAAAWLPPDPTYSCQYVSRQVAVKVKYDLWVTSDEHDAIAVILAGCPGQPLPADG